jgi:phage shock protein A
MNEGSAKRTAVLWIAAVFVLGVALGGIVGYTLAHHPVFASAQLTEQQRRANRVEQLTKELGLSNDQRLHLDTILSQGHGEYKAIHDQADAQMDQARQKMRSQIRAILTPDQLPKFEEFLKRMDEERKKNGPPPPPR